MGIGGYLAARSPSPEGSEGGVAGVEGKEVGKGKGKGGGEGGREGLLSSSSDSDVEKGQGEIEDEKLDLRRYLRVLK